MPATIYYLRTPMTAPAHTLPNRIREHRKAKGLTIEQLAARVGVSKSMMSHLETGRRPLLLDRLRCIARLLDVQIADLLSPSDNPYSPTAEERAFFDTYRALDARARHTVEQVAEQQLAYVAQPAEPEDGQRAA